MIKIVFFGTPYYVIPILEALHKTFKERGVSPIEAVITQSPKPVGRKQILEYSAVDTWAHSKNIPIYFDADKLVKEKIKADVGILASYGDMIPSKVINYFKYGILVVHPSLLPDFRWGSPVPGALVTGTNPSGSTIIKMDDKWDHGPILTQFKEEILLSDNYQTLRDRLFERSAEVLVQALPAYLMGKINLKAQDDSKASFARMIKKEDAFVPPEILWSVISGQWFDKRIEMNVGFLKIGKLPYTTQCTPTTIHNFIRAMTPWPGAWTTVKLQSGRVKLLKRLKILKAHFDKTPSTIHHSLTTKLVLDLVQLEGKTPVSWEQFKEGYPKFEFSS
jgi:methionyl-tRNA formyltransferase